MLVLAALPLAACGGGSKKSARLETPRDVLASALSKTTNVGSEAIRMRAEVKILGYVATMSGSGASDADGDSLSLRLNVGPIHTTAEEIAVENALYMRSPLFTSTLPRGKTWIKLDLSKLETAMGGLLGFAPASFLSALSSPKSVTKIGSSEYHVVPAKGSGSYDVTVGADGYIHHVQSIGSALSLTVDLSDFGRATVAPVPPASKVYTPENGTLPGLGGISA